MPESKTKILQAIIQLTQIDTIFLRGNWIVYIRKTDVMGRLVPAKASVTTTNIKMKNFKSIFFTTCDS